MAKAYVSGLGCMEKQSLSVEVTKPGNYEINPEEGKVFVGVNLSVDAGNIVNTTGDSELNAMSQKATTEAIEASKKEAVNIFGNALKGSVSGTNAVAMDDVSLCEHQVSVKVNTDTIIKSCGKNNADIPDFAMGGETSYTSLLCGDFELPNGHYVVSCDFEQVETLSRIGLSFRKYGSTEYIDQIDIMSTTQKGKLIQAVNITDAYSGGVRIYAYSNMSPDSITTECRFSNFQIELGAIATSFEPYKEGETVTAKAGEEVKITSIAPNMTITTDNGAIIECSYNKDVNIVVEKLTQAIIALGGNV